MKNPETDTQQFTNEMTYLILKPNDKNIPKNYRPTTCLSIMYAILISIVAQRTYNDMQPSKRKRCKKASYGWKDQLLNNQMLLKNLKSASNI